MLTQEETEEEFVGARGTFRYRTVSEANGERKECVIPIPAFETGHAGAHVHSRDPLVVHYCDQRCPTCLYFCEQPFGHEGLHSGAHGMMRNCVFVSEDENIDIGDRKYKRGESGRAEMCDMFCRTLGRGHIHVDKCDAAKGSRCTHAASDGRKHQSCRYGEDASVQHDELTHESHWATIGWKDPCSAAERKEFARCGCFCAHESHLEGGKEPSPCALPLWHSPAVATVRSTSRYVSSDGHMFECYHPNFSESSSHAILLLDESSSMKGQPWADLIAATKEFLAARMGTGDLITIIQHGTKSRLVLEAGGVEVAQKLKLVMRAENWDNDFAEALGMGYEVLQRSIATRPGYQPLLLFMSDGGWNNGETEMTRIGSDFGKHGLQLYTVGFGKRHDKAKMEKLAELGHGTYLRTMTGEELKGAFVMVAASMRKRVALVAK
eukprot:TRINITY_DN1340_c0_g2_i2.p1 TRINITY_DN1340_c0_g2~~TRINITY_DN1340_c0_g2_i2.p1  ORF type:complete len:445 (-),score=51.79 TRINITY_DN1340_c0_g2_i2:282-1592(-)